MNVKDKLRLAVAIVGLFTISYEGFAQEWSMVTNLPTSNGQALACSADGSKIAAIIGGIAYPAFGGGSWIYLSTNSGGDWFQSSAPYNSWYGLASSADGTHLLAAADFLYVSTNSGGTWVQADAPRFAGRYLACSADGSRMVAAATGGSIYLSTNWGANWWKTDSPTNDWTGVASTGDGTRLVAVERAGQIFMSADGGTSWMKSAAPTNFWSGVACAADGRVIVSVASSVSLQNPEAPIYISRDSGVSWNMASAPSNQWFSVACSADGSKITATTVGPPGAVYTSADSGINWSSNLVSLPTGQVASSADGGKLFAVIFDGGVYRADSANNPRLALRTSSGDVVLSWIEPSSPFTLQQSPNLGETNWMDVDRIPVFQYDTLQNVVTLQAPTRPTFYRLRSP